MRVFLKLFDGSTKNLELEGADTIALVRDKIAALVGTHPEHQRLILLGDAGNGTELLVSSQTVAEYSIRMQTEMRLVVRPLPIVITLCVGGMVHIVLLSTLRQVEGSRLDLMFDGVGIGGDAGAGGGAGEGVPLEMSTVYVPRRPDGSYVINRNGAIFSYVLDYLRDLETARVGGAAAAAEPELVLPSADEDLRRLAKEADYLVLPDLAAACRQHGGAFAGRARGPLTRVTHMEFLMMPRPQSQNQQGGHTMTHGPSCPRTDLRAVDLAFTSLYGTNFRECDLRGVDMAECILQNADLRGADLRGANLRECKLVSTDLRGADLREMDMTECILQKADLRGADLRGANLRGAALQGAKLVGAQLEGARLAGMEGAHETFQQRLQQGHFDNSATVFSGVEFRGAIVDEATHQILHRCRAVQDNWLQGNYWNNAVDGGNWAPFPPPDTARPRQRQRGAQQTEQQRAQYLAQHAALELLSLDGIIVE